MIIKIPRDFKTPLLAVFGLILTVVALVCGVLIGTLLPKSAAAAPDSLSGWITTVATSVICVLTIVLAVETWRLRAAQARQLREFVLDSIRPNVSVELSSSHVGVHFMNVRVANSGKGIAKNIRFEFLNRAGHAASSENEPIVKVFHHLGMFRLGIQSLGINQELKSFIFSFLELEQDIGVGVFTPFVNIQIRFEDTEGNEYTNSFVIDFAQYEGFSEIGGDSLHQIASETKSIRQELVKIISGHNRLTVDVHSAADRAAENSEMRARLRRQRAERQG
jgi:hypothetical protein